MVVMERYRERYGKTLQMWLIHRRVVQVTDPEGIKYILHTKALPKTDAFNKVVGVLGRDGLVTIPNERHQAQRRAIVGRFNDDFLHSLHGFAGQALKEFSATLGKAAETGEIVDMDDLLTRLTLDVILRCAFGAKVGNIQSAGDKHPLPAAITVALEEIYQNVVLHPLREIFVSQKPLRTANAYLSEFCQEIIDERRRNPNSGGNGDDLLDIFMNIPGATDEYVIGEVITFLVAGHDTTSHTLAFMFYQLSMHPGIKQKVLVEIDNEMVDPNQTIPAFESIARVSYIRAVWKETLRLHPVTATGTLRTATEDTYLPASKVRMQLNFSCIPRTLTSATISP